MFYSDPRQWIVSTGTLIRSYGGSLVLVDANDATVRGAFPANELSAGLHTGEVIGIFGRVLCLLAGLWLLATIILGIMLWLQRRRHGPNGKSETERRAAAET